MVEKVQLVLPVQRTVAPSGSIVFVKLYFVLQISIFWSTNLCYANLRFRGESSLTDTVGDITVSFTRIDGATNNGITIDGGNSSTIAFTPVSSTEHLNVTITGITMSFNSSFFILFTINYNPGTITGPFTGGTGNSTTATYNGGDTSSAVSTTLTAQERWETRITSLVVNYSYEYYE